MHESPARARPPESLSCKADLAINSKPQKIAGRLRLPRHERRL